MCGRYSLTTPPEAVARLFGLDPARPDPAPRPGGPPPWAPRYNIAPTQPVLAVRIGDAGRREAVFLRWGLIPSWAKDPDIGNRLINARSETAREKPSFRAAWRRRRCLVPATGFYEWQKQGAAKQPYTIAMADGGPFAIAGLWERWQSPNGSEIDTVTLLTTVANETLAPIHARMPVIIAPEDFALWLTPDLHTPEMLDALCVPYDGSAMIAVPVSRHVNNARNDDPACIAPIDP